LANFILTVIFDEIFIQITSYFDSLYYLLLLYFSNQVESCRGCDRNVVGFITTHAISAYHH